MSLLYDRPIHSSIGILAISGMVILAVNRSFPRIFAVPTRERHYSSLPLEERHHPHASREPSPEPGDRPLAGQSKSPLILFVLSICAICMRLELLRRIIKDIQCSRSGIEHLTPLFLALYEGLRGKSVRSINVPDSQAKNARHSLSHILVHGRMRYLLPALFLAWGGNLNARTNSQPRSSYICASILPYRTTVPLYQYAAVLLDSFTLASFDRFWDFKKEDGKQRDRKGQVAIALVFLVSRENVSVITNGKVTGHPAIRERTLAFFYVETASEGPKQAQSSRRTFSRIPSWLYTLLTGLLLIPVYLDFFQNNTINYHPIDLLVDDAKALHKHWIAQATTSRNLGEAIYEYRRRYKRHPPPGFEDWYSFATSHSSSVIDDFDRLNDDILPFWSVSPGLLRSRTWEMISNPWNEISGISIRDGKAEISPNVLPTHRWMLDGASTIINQFAKWLPDMDLAFNLNDECRVAVPWEEIETMRVEGQKAGALNEARIDEWTIDRASAWTLIPQDPISDTDFEDHSFTNTFYEYGSVGCPPQSKARKERIWNTRNLCTSCASPHSFEQFLQNWTLAADICHQPDMANLHGLYLSPAAFKTTHNLMPVFSQSKAHGYNDILYPSPWNYMDKVRYDPSPGYPDTAFKDKTNTLFWRGATSEGVSAEGTWKGMTRQRLVHLANNLTSTEIIPILLPTTPSPDSSSQQQQQQYTYRPLPGSTIRSLLNITDIGIVDKIARCGSRDCPNQEAELGLVGSSDFQDHWRHKYLFDLDGAGFSGRFLPFLQSRSLPFKTALFREWYDDRLMAWLHFVPQDLRLHGVHSTLAYFAGVDAKTFGVQDAREGQRVGEHEREGEWIAEEGRRWAGKVLRKEDMEIYFFRLLLEWGRLTDDKRDEIGVRLNEPE
ncbi:MAG: hypothetical protein M1827_005525 [Pycnora praestabilis]|nr:MAG: hypothetical protein M1827_005525 [Pycnora praestabilis]